MARYLLVQPQARGDNVMMLRLLRELEGAVDLQILGTELTVDVGNVLGFNAFPIRCMPGGISAIYNLKEDGWWRAARDFLKLLQHVRAARTRETIVLFDNHRRPGAHKLLQLLGGNFRYDEPAHGECAYEERRRMLERATGCRIALPPALTPRPPVQHVVIAPTARLRFRAFPAEVVANLVSYARTRGARCTLIDADGRYGQFASQVEDYIARQPLAVSIEHIRSADLLFAPDSLFLHLAYYLGVPAFALIPESIERAGFPYALPGMRERKHFLPFREAEDPAKLFGHLDAITHSEVRLAASY